MCAALRKRHKKKLFLRIILFIIMLLFVITALGLLIFYLKYNKKLSAFSKEARQIVEQSNKNSFSMEKMGRIFYDDKEILATLNAGKNLHYLKFKKIPKNVVNAFIAVEDRRFYKHDGIDRWGIFRALLTYIKSHRKKLTGASTITQQLARNIFLSHEVSINRKIKEAFIALNLEKKYSKDEILEFYINNIYFANGYYGIGAASKGYFNKSVKKLNLSQIAFLAAIPNNPAHYDPLRHKDKTILRRDKILRDMKKQKFITDEEYQSAIDENIKIKKIHKNIINDYETTYAVECAIRCLMYNQGFELRTYFNNKKDYDEYMEEYQEIYDSCRQRLYTEGFDIYTSINKKTQDILQKSIDDVLGFNIDKKKNGIYSFQGAATCIDNKTGNVVGIVGGRSQKNTGFTFNRAFQAYRQPGSSIKPLIVYTPAIENGYTAKTIVKDIKIKDGPANSGNSYLGNIRLDTAVQKSKNVVAWQLFEELTPRAGLSYIQEMMFRKIVPSDYMLAASLGGLTYGVTCEEMAGAYGTLSNNGIFREPTCLLSLKKDNKEFFNKRIEKRIYSAAASQEMTDILRGVLTKGTAAKLRFYNKYISSAAKTGTTNDSKDGWFCGYTPYYSIATWVGYDEPKSVRGLFGASYPGKIWKNAMATLIQGKSSAFFDKSQIGGEKNPTKISEYALSHTKKTTVTDSDTNIIAKIVDFLNRLENLSKGKVKEANKIFKSANELINSLQDKAILDDYKKELNRLYNDYIENKATSDNEEDEEYIDEYDDTGTYDDKNEPNNENPEKVDKENKENNAETQEDLNDENYLDDEEERIEISGNKKTKEEKNIEIDPTTQQLLEPIN